MIEEGGKFSDGHLGSSSGHVDGTAWFAYPGVWEGRDTSLVRVSEKAAALLEIMLLMWLFYHLTVIAALFIIFIVHIATSTPS